MTTPTEAALEAARKSKKCSRCGGAHARADHFTHATLLDRLRASRHQDFGVPLTPDDAKEGA